MFRQLIDNTNNILSIDEKPAYRQFMANPDETLFYKSLGYTSIPDDSIVEAIRSSWSVKGRFLPPKDRNDEREYFKRKLCEYNKVLTLVSNYRTHGNASLEDILKSLDHNESLSIYEGRLQQREQIKSLAINIALSPWNWDIYLGERSKFLISHIEKVCSIINYFNKESEVVPKCNTRIDYILKSDAPLQPLEILFHQAVSGYGDLLSAISLLHNFINTKTWRFELSSNSMVVFNAILKNIGYYPIPIYAIDFAAFRLGQEDFTKYVIYLMQNVESQNIHHELPDSLKFPNDLLESISNGL